PGRHKGRGSACRVDPATPQDKRQHGACDGSECYYSVQAQRYSESYEHVMTQQPLPFIERVCVVNGFNAAQLLPQISYRFVNGRIWTESGKPWIHETAGDVLAVGEKRPRLLPRHVVQKLQEVFPITSWRFLNQIGGIVGCKQAYIQPALSF